MRAVLLALALLAPLLPARGQAIRALLLQQATGEPALTLYALQQAGFATTWANKADTSGVPDTAAGFAAKYDVVFFGTLALEGGLDQVLTPEQLTALKEWVREGGGLVTVIGEAGPTLADLLPLDRGPSAGPMEVVPRVVAPHHPAMQGLPADWPAFGSRYNSFSKITARPGADVLMTISAVGEEAAWPFLLAGTYGEGRVICLNSLWAFSTGQRFSRWGWAPAFFAQTGRWAAHREPLPADQLTALDPLWFWKFERHRIEGAEEGLDHPVLTPVGPPPAEPVRVDLTQPIENRIDEVTGAPEWTETAGELQVRFGSGLRATIDKRGMVGYTTSDGDVLALPPVAETPVIAWSGSTQPELIQTKDGESFVLREALPAATAPPLTLNYRDVQAAGANLEVRFGIEVDGQDEGELLWRFVPSVRRVDGVEWRGIGEQFVIDSPRLYVESLTPRHRWALGGGVDGNFTFRHATYSVPRGFHEVQFDDETSQDAGHFKYFSSGQPFQVLGGPTGTLWSWSDGPAAISSWLSNQAGSGHISLTTKLTLGRRRGRIETPVIWYLATPQPLDPNLWLSCYDAVRRHYRERYDFAPVSPEPTAMGRFSIMGLADLRAYADAILPLAQRLGFKRIDCGVASVNAEMNPLNGGPEALKYLCDQAHAAGIEIGFYAGGAWARDDFKPLQEHPEWIVTGRDGQPQPTGYDRLQTLSLRSGWWDFSLDAYRALKAATGLDAVWVDSWTMPNEYLDWAAPEPSPTVDEGLRYLAAIQDAGYLPWVEGQSPLGLDSFWYRREKYADYRGHEFSLANTSPFAYDGNGLFDLDLFRLLSYHVAMFQDLRLLNEPDRPLTKAVARTNATMNRLHETLGHPTRVRETGFGTIWDCPRGWALFAHESRHLELTLPAGDYRVAASDGQPFTSTHAAANVAIAGTLTAGEVLELSRPAPPN